jgi:asparagine synthase (glutamine-hydrolysing)
MARAGELLGPDGIQIWNSGPAGFAYLKLISTPESISERQPLFDEPSRLLIVFDGRLDNRDDLFRELGSEGPPKDAGDSVLALEMFKRFGDACPDKFVGDFSFAVWDVKERRLFLRALAFGVAPVPLVVRRQNFRVRDRGQTDIRWRWYRACCE